MPDFDDFFSAQGAAASAEAAPASLDDIFGAGGTAPADGAVGEATAFDEFFGGNEVGGHDQRAALDALFAEGVKNEAPAAGVAEQAGKQPSLDSSATLKSGEPAKLLEQGADGSSLFGNDAIQGSARDISWKEAKDSNGDEGFSSIKVPVAVAVSLLTAAALLGALGIPQSIAAKLLPKTGGSIHSILFKIATAGSLVHLKFKKTLIPFRRDETAIDCYAGSGVWLYNQIAARPYLVSTKTEQVWPVEDWDLCGDFEIEVGEFPGRAILMAVCEDGSLSFYCQDDVVRKYRIPTQQEVWLWKTTLSSSAS